MTAAYRHSWTSRGPSDTDRYGAALAHVLPKRGVLSLTGTLGAGKTRLVQAIAAASGIARQAVVSPTFVLCQRYCGDRTIYHLDAYRIRDDDEFLELGVEEYFEEEALTIVEWGERVARCLPLDSFVVDVEVLGETDRRLTFTAGPGQQKIVQQLAQWLNGERQSTTRVDRISRMEKPP